MAENEHVTPEWYYWVAFGQVSPRVLAERLHQHLVSHCDECRAAWEALGDNQRQVRQMLAATVTQHPEVMAPLAAGRPPAPAVTRPPLISPDLESGRSYATAFGRATHRLEREAAELRERRMEAGRELRMLLRHPSDDRRRRIERANARFRSRALAEAVLEESRRRVRNDPREAATLAELVRPILLRTPLAVPSDWASALMIRARAHRANALRVAGDLQDAQTEFQKLRGELQTDPVTELDVMAELDSLEASLRLDQRQFSEAERLLDRSVQLYQRSRVTGGLPRVLVKRAVLQRQEGRLQQCVDDLHAALPGIDPDREAILYLCAIGTLALALCDQAQFGEAAALLTRTASRWRRMDDPWWAARLRVVEGRIALGTEHLAEAEEIFLQVLEDCRSREAHYDAALAALDLALVYHAQGRTAAVKRLTREAAPIFRSRQIHREALAALALVERAVLAEEATRALLQAARNYLEIARDRPDRPFKAI